MTESESEKFNIVINRLLSVSREEIQKRDKEWHRKRAQKKKAKTLPRGQQLKDKANGSQ